MAMKIHIYHHHADEHQLAHRIQVLINKMEQLMTAVSDFATQINAFFDRQDKAIGDLQDDVKTLNDKITELQNSAGTITPEDQKLLDDIQTRASSAADKLDALDALTPPAPPTA